MRRAFLAVAIVLLALMPLQVTPVAAAPSLDLAPWRGTCTTPITAQGTGFIPGATLRFTARREADAEADARTFAEVSATPDGSFAVAIDLAKLFPDCAPAAGLQYRFSAREAATGALLAYAIYAVDPAPGPTATLTLSPASGPCPVADPQIAARGTNFPPGVTVRLDVRPESGPPTTFPVGPVAANGTFATTVRLFGCGPTTPIGTVYTVVAYSSDIPGAEPQALLATATYIVAAPTDEKVCFPQTGRCLAGRFLDRWRATGGLPINGYPISDVLSEQLEDGKSYPVQYFERVRMEYHPETSPPFDVQLGQLGRRILAGVPNAATAPVGPRDGAAFFPETGHNVDADMIAYWVANGGLAQFGYPLTEEFVARLENGELYVVQYFERARFERHPENAMPYKILLGQFGRRICGAACR